jgi:hypothetical protein
MQFARRFAGSLAALLSVVGLLVGVGARAQTLSMSPTPGNSNVFWNNTSDEFEWNDDVMGDWDLTFSGLTNGDVYNVQACFEIDVTEVDWTGASGSPWTGFHFWYDHKIWNNQTASLGEVNEYLPNSILTHPTIGDIEQDIVYNIVGHGVYITTVKYNWYIVYDIYDVTTSTEVATDPAYSGSGTATVDDNG